MCTVQYVPDHLVYAGGVSDVTYCVQYVPDNLVYAGGGGFPQPLPHTCGGGGRELRDCRMKISKK